MKKGIDVQEQIMPSQDVQSVSRPQDKTVAGGMKKRRKRNRVKKGLLILLIFLLLTGSAFGIYLLFFRETPMETVTGMTMYGSLDRSIEGSGTTVPKTSLSITAVSSAVIEEVFVKEGDTVAVGDLLYTQDDSEIDDKIAGFEDQILTLQDEISEHESAIADQQSTILETNDKISEYYTTISEYRETMNSLTVTAPFDGKITGIHVQDGKNINQGTALAQLTDEHTMEVTLYYSYAYEGKMYIGMPAEVSVSSLLWTLPGSISDIQWIDWTSSEGMRCFAVTVQLENPGILKENDTASALLTSSDGTRIAPAASGKLTWQNSETLSAEASGKLLSVHVSEYDTVYAGQTLFVIDSESYQKQIESVEKQITSAQKQIENADKQIENYKKKMDTANDKIAALQENIAETEESRSNYAMTSEIAGKVMYVNAEAGDRPNMMNPIITIYNLDTMNISVNFDELDVDYIREGTPVTITRTSAEKTYRYQGTITYLSPEAASSNGVATFPATIEILANGELSSGISVTYSISLGDSEEGVLAPVDALKSHEEQYYLYVKSETRPENAVDLTDPETEIPDGFWAVPVEVGNANASYIRILSGIDAGVEVFTRYRQTAPSGGNTTSENMEEGSFPMGDMSGFRDQFAQGGFGGMGGGTSGGVSGGGFAGSGSAGGTGGRGGMGGRGGQ